MERKYSLIIFGLVMSLLLFLAVTIAGYLGFFPRQFIENFINPIPDVPGIPGILTDLIILYLLPVLMVSIIFLISPLMVKFFYKIHRIINRYPKYGIIEMEERKPKFHYLFFRVFVVGLFAFSLMSILMEFGFGSVFREAISMDWELVFKAEAAFLGTYFLAPFILLIFVPLWIMEDSGLISYKSFSNQRRSPDIEGMHTTYSHLLEAYSGVSTLLILFTYVYEASSVVFTKPENFFPNIMSFISIMVLPITITGIFAFGVFLYEKFIGKTRERIQKAMLDEGFVRIRIPEMDELKE